MAKRSSDTYGGVEDVGWLGWALWGWLGAWEHGGVCLRAVFGGRAPRLLAVKFVRVPASQLWLPPYPWLRALWLLPVVQLLG
jgi:hypothetical protein